MSLPEQQPVTPPQRGGRRGVWLLALVGVAAVAVGVVVWRSGSADAGRAEALQAARDGDFSKAEPGLKAAHERNPADAEVVAELARGYQKAGDPAAEPVLTRWVELQPDNPEALQARMEFYRQRNDDRSLADARRLLELDPDNQQLRRSVMGQAFSFGRFEEAEELCRACLKVQPGDPWLRTMLAEIRRARGDAAGAAAILDELIKENPKATGPLLARANLYEEAGESAKAVPLLREVFRLDPKYRRAAGYQLAVALERTGQPEEARKVRDEVRRLQDVEVFSEAIKTQPDNLDLKVRLARSLLADGHTQDGVSLLNAVLSQDPGFRPAHAAFADYFENEGQPARAAEHRRRAGP